MFAFGQIPPDVASVLAGVLTPEQAESQAGFFQLARAGHALLETLEQLTRRHDLTPAQFRLLMVLRFVHPEGVSMSQAAEVLDIRPPSLTEIVRTAPDLFVRSSADSDRRRVILTASPEGCRRLDGALPEIAAHAVSLKNALGADDWDTLVDGADRLFDVTMKGNP